MTASRVNIPVEVLAQIPQVYEVLITTRGPLEPDLWAALVARPGQAGVVAVLVQDVFDLNYILQMLEAGFTVYEAQLPAENLIFLDRDQGYRLATWEPLPDPFTVACQLAWRRTGTYTCIRDTVTLVSDSQILMKVKEHHYLWFSLRHVTQAPRIGERVKILTYHPFMDVGDLCGAVAILPDDEGV